MLFRNFSLHPGFFDSFKSTSLIARGIEKKIIDIEVVNWREDFGIGNYKQVDDKPYGGGNGMVLMTEPIYGALQEYEAISSFFKPPTQEIAHQKFTPNNPRFFEAWQKGLIKQPKATISLTPRGYPLNQQIVEWLSQNFDELNILCGRYEGFDHRVDEMVDLELSVGDFVLNGGESASLCLIEAVSRLRPGFITKEGSVLHDSFSTNLNRYGEHSEYIEGKNRLATSQRLRDEVATKKIDWKNSPNLFDQKKYIKEILPRIEHPQYTRSEVWNNWKIPDVLLSGDLKKIQTWRENWYKETAK